MGILEQLFRKQKDVTARDLKVALAGLKRDGRKKQLELRKLASKRSKAIERIKKARREGNDIEVDLSWEELRQLRVDTAYAKREAKILSLESIAVTRYQRSLERLERGKDPQRIQSLLNKVRTSGLEEKLRAQEVDEAAYMDELNATIEEVGLEVESLDDESDDPEKERFLADIDAINEAEAGGELDIALEKEEELQKRLEQDKLDEDKL